MTKETFERQQAEITNKISDLQQLIKQLSEDYIEANKPFNIGDKIKVTDSRGNEKFGIVFGFEIGYSNKVKPRVHKIKKDGTESSQNIYIFFDEKIELAN